MAAIARLRGWALFAGLELLGQRGLLWQGCMWDEIKPHVGETFPAWIITDSARRNAQGRRLDGRPWTCGKAKSLPGSIGAWPIGAPEIGDREEVWLCEGQPDFCAALLVAYWNGVDTEKIAPVCITGTSNSIHPDALHFFQGKKVFIPAHADADGGGQAAARKWAGQLMGAGAASVEGLRIPPPCKDLSDYAATFHSPDDPTPYPPG